MFRKALPFVLIYTVIGILYYPVISTYFSHDDFFHFKVSITDGSLKSFIGLFGFYPFDLRGIAFYRPIFREVLYNTFYWVFGLNVIPFRILQFMVHFTNVYLVFRIVQKIYEKRIVSFFSAFFFGICAANVASFYYLAGGIQIQGATMFILLSLLLFDKYKILSFVTFLAALTSHEQAALTPIILSGLIFMSNKFKGSLKKIVKLWPYFLAVGVYVFLNIKVIGYSSAEAQYQFTLNPKTAINTAAWYGIWALGAPETLIDFVNPGLTLNPSLLRYWGNYYRIIFPAILISGLIIISSVFVLLLRARKIFKDKRLWFFVCWFPIVLLPVLFLPQHKSAYYLYPALPAFWAAIGIILFEAYRSVGQRYFIYRNALLILLVASLVALSATSAILGRTTYWAATRGRLAEKVIQTVKEKFPTLPHGSAVHFTNDPTYPYVAEDWKGSSRQASFALNGEDSLQLIYKDPSLRVFYEDTGGVPEDFQKDKTYSLIAPY